MHTLGEVPTIMLNRLCVEEWKLPVSLLELCNQALEKNNHEYGAILKMRPSSMQ